MATAYKDLDLGLRNHPSTGDIALKIGDSAIQQSIKNITFTLNYERPFFSQFGTPIRKLLFEPDTSLTRLALQRLIKYSILNFEPRVNNVNVVVNSFPEKNAYDVHIFYTIVGSNIDSRLQLTLERLR